MKTDKELLRLAAKAAGLEIDVFHDTLPIAFLVHTTSWNRGVFNPLFDNGDAFRLSVRLRLSIMHDEHLDGSQIIVVTKDVLYSNVENVSSHQDSLAATRRAIVKAAAEIGEEMEGM